MLILGISFKQNSDALLSRDGWPTWLVNGIDYLQEASEEEAWVSLLVSFVGVEQQLGPNKIVRQQSL